MASPDHYQAMLITEAAIFYSRLTKWDEHFEGLPVHAIPVSMYFQLAFEAVSDLGFSSQITVDISDQLEKKLDSVRCYKTQFPPEKQRVLERVRPRLLPVVVPQVLKLAKCCVGAALGLRRPDANHAAAAQVRSTTRNQTGTMEPANLTRSIAHPHPTLESVVWLLHLRWVAVAGQLCVIAGVQWLLRIPLPIMYLLGLVGLRLLRMRCIPFG